MHRNIQAYLANEVFVPRKRYWEDVQSFLDRREENREASPILFIGGLGGAGKTTMAAKGIENAGKDDATLFLNITLPGNSSEEEDPNRERADWDKADWAKKLKGLIDELQEAEGSKIRKTSEKFHGFFEFYERSVSQKDTKQLAIERGVRGVAGIVGAIGIALKVLEIPGMPLPDSGVPYFVMMAVFALALVLSILWPRIAAAKSRFSARDDLQRTEVTKSALPAALGQDRDNAAKPLEPEDFPDRDTDSDPLSPATKFALDMVLTDMFRLGLARWLKDNPEARVVIVVDIQKVPPSSREERARLRDLIDCLASGPGNMVHEKHRPLDNRFSVIVLSQFSAFEKREPSPLLSAIKPPVVADRPKVHFEVEPFTRQEAWDYTCQSVLHLAKVKDAQSGSGWIAADLARYAAQFAEPGDNDPSAFQLPGKKARSFGESEGSTKLSPEDAHGTLKMLAFGQSGSDLLPVTVLHRLESLFEHLDTNEPETSKARSAQRQGEFIPWLKNFLGRREYHAARNHLGERKFQNEKVLLSLAALAALSDTHPPKIGVSEAIWEFLSDRHDRHARLLDLGQMHENRDFVRFDDEGFLCLRRVTHDVITSNGLHWALLNDANLLKAMQLHLLSVVKRLPGSRGEERLSYAQALVSLSRGYASKATAIVIRDGSSNTSRLSKVGELDAEVRGAIETAVEAIQLTALEGLRGDDAEWKERCRRTLQDAAVTCCELIRPEAASSSPVKARSHDPLGLEGEEQEDEANADDVQDWLSVDDGKRDSSIASLRCIAAYLDWADGREMEESDRLALIAARSRITSFINAHEKDVREQLAKDLRRGFRRLERELVDYGSALDVLEDEEADLAGVTEAAEIVHGARKRIAADGQSGRLADVPPRFEKCSSEVADVDTSIRALTIWRKIANSQADKSVARSLHDADTPEKREAAVAAARETYILPFLHRVDHVLARADATPEQQWTLHWLNFQGLLYWLHVVARNGAPFDTNVLGAMKSSISGMRECKGSLSAEVIHKMNDVIASKDIFEAIEASDRELTKGLFDEVPNLLIDSIADYLESVLVALQPEAEAAFSQDRDLERAAWCELLTGVAHCTVPKLESSASDETRKRVSTLRRQMLAIYARAVLYRVSRFNDWRTGLSAAEQQARIDIAVERFSDAEYTIEDERGFANAFVQFIANFTPTHAAVTPGSMIAARIARLEHKAWSFNPFASYRIGCRTTLLPSSIYIAQNGNSSGVDSPDHVELRDGLRGNLILTRALHFEVNERPQQFAVSAKGSDYVAQLMYVFGAISDPWKAIEPSADGRRSQVLDNGSLWMGGSNSIAVLRVRSDMMTALLRQEGHLIRKLKQIAYLNDISLYSAEPADDVEQEMRHFTSKRFKALRLFRKENSQIEFIPSTPAIDNRKNRTFLSLFDTIFNYPASIHGWTPPDNWTAAGGMRGEENERELEDA